MEVVPGDHSTNSVGVLCRPELADFVGAGGSARLVSDANLPILVRQISLHADVSSLCVMGSMSKGVFISSVVKLSFEIPYS